MRKMNTKYFHCFLDKINTFRATDCHLNPIQNTSARNFSFYLIRFNPVKFEKALNSVINSIIDFISLKKKVVSPAQAVYKNSCLIIFKLLTIGFFLTNAKNTSKASTKHYTDIGSPYRAPLSDLKYFVIFLPLMMQDS